MYVPKRDDERYIYMMKIDAYCKESYKLYEEIALRSVTWVLFDQVSIRYDRKLDADRRD